MSEKTGSNFKTKFKDIMQKIGKAFASAKCFWIAVAILVILLIVSIIVLSVRLFDYVKTDDRAVSLRSSMDETLNVFAMEYENDTGDITIEGSDGSKVIAPGSEVEYTLRLRNTDKLALDYTFVPDLEYTSDYELPIMVRLLDPDDKYVAGSETEWIPIAEIAGIEAHGTLMTNETAEYLFQWKWPYESGDDAYDSFLGSAAFDSNIGLELSFSLHSEANTSAEANGGFFKAPLWKVIAILIVFILLAVAITLLLIYIIKKIKEKIEEKIVYIEVPVVKTVEVAAPAAIAPEPQKIGFTGKMAYVNIEVLDAHFNSGDRISLSILKERKIVPPSTKQMKILSKTSKPLEKAFIVETQGISKEAEITIRCAGGKVIIAAPDGDKKN